MSDERPILLLDSGVGGLSVLGHVARALPHAPLIYAADNGGFPYGTKSEAEIAARVPALLERLVERHAPRIVVIACNTASTIALAAARAALAVPVVGTVPAIRPAALASRTRVIGVLGTEATVRQPYVDRLSALFAADCTVLRQGSAALVRIAEDRLRGRPVDPAAVAAELDRLLAQPGGDRLDTVVLACTHFPLLADVLAASAPRPLGWIDSGAGIARRVASLTAGQDWPAARAEGLAVFTAPLAIDPAFRATLAGHGLTRTAIL